MGDSHAGRSLEQLALMNEPGPSAATMPAQASFDWLQRRIVFAAVTFALALLAVQAFQAWDGYRTARTEAERRADDIFFIFRAPTPAGGGGLVSPPGRIRGSSGPPGGPAGGCRA